MSRTRVRRGGPRDIHRELRQLPPGQFARQGRESRRDRRQFDRHEMDHRRPPVELIATVTKGTARGMPAWGPCSARNASPKRWPTSSATINRANPSRSCPLPPPALNRRQSDPGARTYRPPPAAIVRSVRFLLVAARVNVRSGESASVVAGLGEAGQPSAGVTAPGYVRALPPTKNCGRIATSLPAGGRRSSAPFQGCLVAARINVRSSICVASVIYRHAGWRSAGRSVAPRHRRAASIYGTRSLSSIR